MSSDVFQPTNGPLILRGAIATGMPQPMDSFKKNQGGSLLSRRPSTRGGYRFGQMSHSSFFARHNPHPGRVRHIKGLLDVPICSVNDDGCLSNPRYAPQFPPNSYDSNKLKSYSKYYNVPSNAINVNSQMYPVNTITGLQYFLGKPLNMRIFREKLKARPGMGTTNEGWRDELKALTEALGINPQDQHPPAERKPETGRPKTQYSETTGRLLPPPSRGMSRSGGGGLASRQRESALTATMQSLGVEEMETEHVVLGILAQILQTDDVGSVQQWLVGAGDREKGLVLDMIRAALDSKDDYYRHLPAAAEYIEEPIAAALENGAACNGGVIGDEKVNEKIDRLSLEPPTPPIPRPPSQPHCRPSSQQNGRPSTQQNGRLESRQLDHATMRYTYTPQQRGADAIAEEDVENNSTTRHGGGCLPAIAGVGRSSTPDTGGAVAPVH